MRVLHVISGIEPENGGPTVALCGLVRALKGVGVDSEIVATWKAESAFGVADALRADGIPVTLLGPTRRPFRTHPDSERVLSEAVRRADAVHIHAVWEDIQHRAARIAHRLRKPYVWTPHGLLDRWNMKRNRVFKEACLGLYLRRSLNRAAAIHTATGFERDQLARLGLKPPVIVQGFGVEDRLFDPLPERGAWRRANGVPNDAKLVLYLGRIQRGKGLEHLIPALSLVSDSSVILIVAGPDEGGYQTTIENLVERHGVNDRVRFVGMVRGEQKVALLHDADVLAAPSEHESFGIAVAEALAVGTPVVLSEQVGLAGVVVELQAGVVCDLVPRSVADALMSSLTRPGLERQAVRQKACGVFAWQSVGLWWKDRLQSLSP